jgi:hypothetical protein
MSPAYTVDVREDDPDLTIFGQGGVHRARVFEGRISRELEAGLKALECPQRLLELYSDWKVSCPETLGPHQNAGAERQFLILAPSTGIRTVLQFHDRTAGRLSHQLESEIRAVLEQKISVEEYRDHERHRKEVVQRAREAGDSRQGKRRQYGQDPGRQADGHEAAGQERKPKVKWKPSRKPLVGTPRERALERRRRAAERRMRKLSQRSQQEA